jgi:dihydrolipoamide dehydrogenase
MSEDSEYDLVIIGGGPGGYVAAIRAAQLKLKVACVERERLGGICSNWGCIPTKALLRSAEVLDLCRRAAEFGVKIDGTVAPDFPAIMQRSRKVVDMQERGIVSLFKKNKIDHIPGTARLGGAGRVQVQGRSDEKGGAARTLTAKRIIVATGARAKSLPGVAFSTEDKRIIEYRGALSLPAPPRSMVIIGAGAIGVEFASFFRTLGVEVALVEFLPQIVPLEDHEIAAELARAFRRAGIKMLTRTKVTAVTPTDDGVTVSVEDREDASRKQELTAEMALMATGIQANVEDLGLEEVGVKINRGFIEVDDVTYQTNVAGIYAIGDVAGPPALAHVASAEGIACVERIAGLDPPPIDYDSVPACTFCHPEIGSIGLTENQAKDKGVAVKIGRFPFRAVGKARAAGDTEGMVKVLYAADDGRIVGAHIIGPGASDLIAEYALAKTTEANGASLIHTIHAHPTFAEALREASEDAYGHAIHI